MSAVVLAPGELAVEQARVDGRHLRHPVVLGHAEVARPEQPEDRAGRHRGHVAALLVEPVGVALLRDAVADEGGARRAEGDQLVRIDREVARVLAAERRLGGAVLQEVAGHPVVLAGAGEVLDRLAEVAAVQLGAAFAGRADQDHREARLEGHGDERGLAVARDALRCRRAWRRPRAASRGSRGRGPRPRPRRAASPSARACGAGPCW